MKKQLIAAIAAAAMLTSAFGGLSAGASYSEEVSVYVNGNKIDNGTYKPVILNDRTMVRVVPIFDALGYSHTELDKYNSVIFQQKGSNAAFRFIAEKNYAVVGTGYDEEAVMSGEDTTWYYHFDVPATLNVHEDYKDVFYVPIRAFCEMVGLDIEWDTAARSVYIGSKPQTEVKKQLTYDEAREIATNYVNDDSILLSVDKDLVSHNGRQAYAFTLRFKGDGSGTMGTTVYVYADNGEVDVKDEAPGSGTNNNSGSTASLINTTNNMGDRIGTEYCCCGLIVAKGTIQEFGEGKYNYNQLKAISESYIEKAPDYKTSTGLNPQQALDLINAAYEQSFTGSVDIYSNCIAVHTVKENLVNSDLCQYRVSYYPNGLGNHVGEPCYLVAASTDETFSDTNSTGRILDKDYNIIDVAN